MTQRTKTLLIVFGGAIVVVVAGVIVWLLTQQQEEPLTNTTVTNNVNTVVVNTAQTNGNQNTNTETDETVAARRLANLFVERFGSYSSEAQFQNILDLKKFMTKKMQAWADAYVMDQKKQTVDNASFRSITAKVITTSVVEQSAGGTTFRMTTIRTTDDGTTNGKKTYNQDIVIQAVLDGTDWKIDSAYWQ